MYMMFVDESGDKGYPKDGNWGAWKGSTHFTRVGVIIHGWKWKGWNERIVHFKRNRGLTWDAEIKASHIRRGQGDFIGWEKPRRELFINDILDLIGGNTDITLICIIIDKSKVDITQRDRLIKPDVRSMELLLERYNSFLDNQSDKCGIVVLDPTQEKDDDNIRHFQSYLQAYSQHLQPLHIVESTFYAKSHTSNMIQVADICTNVIYRRKTGKSGSLNEYNKIYPRFLRHGRRVVGCGIKEWP